MKLFNMALIQRVRTNGLFVVPVMVVVSGAEILTRCVKLRTRPTNYAPPFALTVSKYEKFQESLAIHAIYYDMHVPLGFKIKHQIKLLLLRLRSLL